MTIEFDEETKEWLANRGFDEVYGARPLRRVIQRDVLNPLSKSILSGSIKEKDHIIVKLKKDDSLTPVEEDDDQTFDGFLTFNIKSRK